MQIAQDFLSRAPAENPAHSGLCKGFSTGTIGRKDKQDAQVIFEQFLTDALQSVILCLLYRWFFSRKWSMICLSISLASSTVP